MGASEFSDFLGHCKTFDDSSWSQLKSSVGDLMTDYAALRGSLAHSLFYVMSSIPKSKVGIATVANSFLEFQDDLVEYFGPNVSTFSDKQPISHFMQRQTEQFEDPGNYLTVVLYLVGVASSKDNFFSHYIIKEECPDISTLIGRLLDVCRVPGYSLTALSDAVGEYRTQYRGRHTIQHDLGGMLELGSFDQESLWQTIFLKNSVQADSHRGKKSLEKRYICYRYSSVGGMRKIVKSFLVLQSPGSVRGHFAFKAFYRPDSEEMIRRSAGAIVRLGDTISCYGSSRLLSRDHDASPMAVGEEYHSGPKVMVFDQNSFKSADPVIPGTLLTMNENIQPIISRIVCVETSITHSDSAGIGTFDLVALKDELFNHTILGKVGKRPRSTEQLDRIWQRILELLKASPEQGVVLGLQKHDLDLRAFV